MTARMEPVDQPMEESDRVKPVLFCVYIFGAKENGARVAVVGILGLDTNTSI